LAAYACENSKAQNDLLKRELGYKGYVLSDWQATMSGPPSVNAGLDMTMVRRPELCPPQRTQPILTARTPRQPGDVTFNSGSTYFGANLTLAVNNGSVPLDRVKDMAVRILSSWFLLEQDRDFPATNFDSWDPLGKGEHIDVRADHHEYVRANFRSLAVADSPSRLPYRVIREIGAASTILLKNVTGALPLGRDLKTIALIGNAAGPSSKGPNGYADRGGLDGVLGEGYVAQPTGVQPALC
jgi:beta-glucosidase-like glycosyl hydrolase